jgi:hypothetical protein
MNWLRVVGTAKPAHIDQGVCHQVHAKMSLLNTLKTKKQPLEFLLNAFSPSGSSTICVSVTGATGIGDHSWPELSVMAMTFSPFGCL